MGLLRRCYVPSLLLLVAALLGVAMAALPAVAGSEEPPSIAAHDEGVYYHSWQPSTATVSAGGVVKFSNPYNNEAHGLKFTGGSAGATPSCTGIPLAAGEPSGATGWQGECTFSAPGTYTFICTVHPTEMRGTVTVPGTPTAATEQATEVAQTNATLNGTVRPAGNVTEYYFEYGTSTVTEQTTSALSVGAADFGAHAVMATLAGLSPASSYHVQLVAIYGASRTMVLGGEQMLTTLALAAPTVVTGQTTGLQAAEATLSGTVSPGGQLTSYFFQYGLSTSYEATTPIEHTGPEGVSHVALAALTGLAPDTVYHYRLLAQNASDPSGPVAGADETFTTAPPLPPASPPSSPPATPPASTSSPSAPPSALAPVLTTPMPIPVAGPLLGSSPKLAASQRASSVRGTVNVAQAGVGGRLEVVLLVSGASLARAGRRPSRVRVGRFVRSGLRAGVVSFVVPLTGPARSALRRHRRLALTVEIVLTPAHGAAVTVTRSVVLHA